MSDRSFFEQKMSDFPNRSFFAHFCFFALFERAKERLSERLLFCNERMSNKSLNCSFAMSK